MRWRKRLGPVQITGLLGIAPSTVHAVLVRCRINRLSFITRITGEPVQRYEHAYLGTGVESTSRSISCQDGVSFANAVITAEISGPAARTRLLYPD